jgi:hypothetical protein
VAKALRKTLPKDFEALLAEGDFAKLTLANPKPVALPTPTYRR